MTTYTIKKFIKSGSADDPSCYKLVECKVGDYVCFKSDYEQSGRIQKITPRRNFYSGSNDPELVLVNENGFGGEYLRYATHTVVCASDCWL